MARKILLSFAGLGVLLLAVAYFTFSTLINKGVKSAVETFGPDITQTEVRLEGANISPLNGTGVLKGLFIGNPKGFKSEKAFSANRIEVNFDLASLLSDKIVIERIYVSDPHVVYEKKLLTDNLKQLLKNIEESPLVAEGDSESEIRLEIKELSIVNGKITVGILGKETVNQLIGQASNSPLILYHLGKNPEKAQRIAELVKTNPIKGVMELGALAANLKATKVKRNQAPNPDDVLEGAKSPSKGTRGPKGAVYS